MNCETAKERMADKLAGIADPALDEHLRACASCGTDAARLTAAWERLDAWHEVEPPAQVRVRFDEMLDAYHQGLNARTTRSWRTAAWWPSRPALQFALAFSFLAAGFFGGRTLQPTAPPAGDVAELRKEMAGMRQLVTLSLLQQQSATERLRGVTWSYRTEPDDTEVLGALLTTINTDSDVNVRLAAIDAVRNLASSPVARRGLVQALAKQSSPLVQVELVNTLVDLKQRDARPQIEAALRGPDIDPGVRRRFEAALRRLE